MRRKNGFTLTELLVVIAIILVLFALLLPAFGRVRSMVQKVQCMHNVRQLATGWILYASDNGGHIVSGSNTRYGAGIHSYYPNGYYLNAWSMEGFNSWGNSVAAITNGALWPYVRSLKTYQCPADHSGHLRSYSINLYLHAEADDYPHGYCTVTECLYHIAEVSRAARTLVFMEENDTRGWNMNGYVLPGGPCLNQAPLSTGRWVDFVANFHNGSDNMSFADGHVENWRWQDHAP